MTFYEIQEVAVCSSVCVSLLRFCMLANKYFDILQIRITFCWKNKSTVHVDTQGSEISANFDIGHFCFVLYGKFYTSAFE